MESSILESIGVEIIGVMTPVSICMLLVVLLVYALTPSSPDPTPFALLQRWSTSKTPLTRLPKN
uniref:Uncharacterized protein n=1 Tax=Nelumbo nucifera TaxID=4432 RepID=A0A822ZCQ0_NELNU|nr:TPA_asm: hypothetical protein HUJ06_015528 [Nelumbo nucifera]